ncbi:HK97-gp10 family putative phage morphogenesis protein [Thermoanaerobacterium thermosulfurigenes]|uniref:HK97-gp10 family putative phage morphogenesis protein n=1 Tax=Thermoanaerobacterium thermosulfurigenes TaxID=33950 RepID=UPI003EFB3677
MDNSEITGLDEILKNLEQKGINVSRLENQALKNAGEIIKESAKQKVHVSKYNEEHIRDHIDVSNVKTKDDVKYIEVGVDKELSWRAKFVEWGTSKMQARPFLQPAYEENIEAVQEEIAKTLKEGLQE